MKDDISRRREERVLESLLRHAGRGPHASPDARTRIYAAVHEKWRNEVETGQAPVDELEQRRARRQTGWVPLALAAGIGAIAVTAYLQRSPDAVFGADFASISRVEGSARILRDGERLDLADSDATARIGDLLTTGQDSGAALRLMGGEMLRVAAATELRLTGPDRIHLVNGMVYFDSNDTPAESALAIETAFGSIRHTGTQYLAGVTNAGLMVQVREGSVAFSDDSRSFTARSGEALQISRTGAPERSTISSADPSWTWAAQLASLPEGADHPVVEILEWIGHETGTTVRFDAAETELRAQNVVISGLAGLTPDEALEALRGATAFGYTAADDGILLVTANTR